MTCTKSVARMAQGKRQSTSTRALIEIDPGEGSGDRVEGEAKEALGRLQGAGSMMDLSLDVRVRLAIASTDMYRGLNGMAQLVRDTLK